MVRSEEAQSSVGRSSSAPWRRPVPLDLRTVIEAWTQRFRSPAGASTPSSLPPVPGIAAPLTSRTASWQLLQRRLGRRGLLAGAVLLIVAGVIVLESGLLAAPSTRSSHVRVAPSPSDDPQSQSTLPIITRGSAGAGSDPIGRSDASGVATESDGPVINGSSASGPGSPSTIVVHAAGMVVNPGVYLLPADARVDDVIHAAAGMSPGADVDVVNLAARVHDGERVFVPRTNNSVPAIETNRPAAVPVAEASNTGGVGPIDLNTATAEQLDALPGVGPATAAAIVEYRRVHQRFRSVGELLEVPGIGESKLANLKPRVTVGGSR